MSFIAALDAELEDLHAKLSDDPIFVKWNELQRVRRLYGPAEADELPAFSKSGKRWVTMPTPEAPKADEGTLRGRRGDPERAKAIEEAFRFVESLEGTPTPNADVLQHLTSLGITINGEKPLNNLSAMMSNSGLFTANGRRGWTIRQEGDVDQDVDEEIRERLNDTVESFAKTFDEDAYKYIRAYFRDQNQIPSDYDGKLLATTRAIIGRDLSELERMLLRDTLMKVVYQHSSPT